MARPFVWSLQPVAQAVSVARGHLRQLCNNLPAPLLDDALLLMSELVTNAIRHGDGEVTVRLWPRPDSVRIEVTDASPRYPVATDSSVEAESGRGLHIVEALASRWGTTPAKAPSGKTVWVEIDAMSE